MNQPLRMCPCCGYDLAVDVPILINDFAMNGAGYPLMYKGMQVKLPPQRSMVCWTLMKAYPRRVSIESLLNRVMEGYDDDGEDKSNLIRVHVSRIRQVLREMGAPNPIKTMRNAYIWEPRGVMDDETIEALSAS